MKWAVLAHDCVYWIVFISNIDILVSVIVALVIYHETKFAFRFCDISIHRPNIFNNKIVVTVTAYLYY
jgi:hypothetical protein